MKKFKRMTSLMKEGTIEFFVALEHSYEDAVDFVNYMDDNGLRIQMVVLRPGEYIYMIGCEDDPYEDE